MKLFDAHNHLQEDVFKPHLQQVMEDARKEGICRMVVNGSSEDDWDAVSALANLHAEVLPAFGYHPWYVKQRSPRWQENLTKRLNSQPSAVGEIGLDRWIKCYDIEDQLEVFSAQLRMAAARNVPASIHCLRAWGKLLEALRATTLPRCGFLLHSYGGPAEMVDVLVELGAYFSLPGYFAHERKTRQREVFKRVPASRLLIETDAPDQLLPAERVLYPCCDDTGKAVNHPGNLRAVYLLAAEIRQEPIETIAHQVAENFSRLFGGLNEGRATG
jgi:TatD DNase family protein